MNHGWVFDSFTGGRTISHIPTCIINIEGFSELKINGVKFNQLRAEYMSMHFKQGSLCISPNNHKVKLNTQLRINKCWTVSLNPEAQEAVVSLQWLILDPTLSAAFYNCKTLRELIDCIGSAEIAELFRYFR